MKKVISIMTVIFIISTLFTPASLADNPIIQTNYTADPAPIVYDDTVYLYTGHDLEIATTSYKMVNWKCYSSKDMVNWTDHGTVLNVSAFDWARHDQDANAAHVIYRNGKFYYFVSVSCTLPGKGGIAIGVAVSDSPTGPFVDAIGGPLVTNDMTKYASHSWDDLDPAVFIDDDGQAYLYWGNNACYYAKLNEDMISLDGEIGYFDITDQAQFGPDYEEAPWVFKRNGIYYLVYAAQFPEHIAYSTSTSPTGPWTYRGVIMPRQGNSSTNHPGIIEYKGDYYLFYHNDWLPGGDSYHRSVCVEKLEFKEDGSISTISMTREGAPAIANLNPYARTEAETICWSSGVKTEPCNEGGMNVCDINDGDYIKVARVDFGDKGAAAFTAKVASGSGGGEIELRLDSADGEVIGTLPIGFTGGWDNWVTKTTSISGVTG
ncbi:MAG: family 43 glycosylhydrolase, partial [Clostridiaceae bacterium]|nr:family 43 glycosylhydrolase [Clostridiaceae bacterium]